ncbi:MAG TPA: hypothetical protein VLB07_07045 [Woeseiaceae bacterium]|nr:hypothetical protein [Woeseiaceae bacterium]
MTTERLANWLQIAANVGIIGGLVLVGFQLNQNSEILQAQMMSAESRSVIDQEMQIIGGEGAAAWVSAMSDPMNVSPEHHRIMEAIFWSAVESWRHIEQLDALGLAEVDPRTRVTDEAPWYFGNAYGRAWWHTRRDGSGLSEDLKVVIDEAIRKNPNNTTDIHNRLIEEIRRSNGHGDTEVQRKATTESQGSL